jgi:hypothetical protein
MRRIVIAIVGALGLVASGWIHAAGPSNASQQPGKNGDVKSRFAGTWRLVGTDRLGPKDEVLPPQTPAGAGQIGFIIYDPAGFMGVTIMQNGRQKYADPQQPTPEEARTALTSYTSYFGAFTVNESEGVVTHRLQGSISPMMAADQRRHFEFSGNRLMLRPPRNPTTGIQARLTWERVPDLATLTPTHRRFIGFWKLISNERRRLNGEVISSNPGQTGFIIYTASGHMAVHLAQPGRKPYAAAAPTPAEALEAMRTYTSYFGPYTIHEKERYVVHHRIGITNPSQIGTDAQRFYEFSGRRLILRPPQGTADGLPVQGVITWERLGAEPPATR